jgi:hypothetical protein
MTMTRERFWFLIGNVATVGMTVAPFFVPALAPLSSPEAQAALLGGGAVAVNVVRDIVQRAK